jgi:AcrR family transcriptional regulator
MTEQKSKTKNKSPLQNLLAQSDDQFFKICNSVLKLEVSKGHLKWTLSDISREAQVTRSLIYYYLGKDKYSILEQARKYMIDIFFSAGSEVGGDFAQRMKPILSRLNEMPYLFILFYLERGTSSDTDKMIIAAEEKLLDDLAKYYPMASRAELFKSYLLELGAIAYKLPPSRTEEIFK